jgi:hypothetical protein
MLVCSSALSSCLTTFISSGGLACCEITTGMVYDHRQTGFYTDGVRTSDLFGRESEPLQPPDLENVHEV